MDPQIVERLALHLMRSHGLTDEGWRFQWDSAYKRFGLCNYKTRTISMSRQLTLSNNFFAARDTVGHEVAHALTPGAGHGIYWKRKAVELGATPKACFSWDDVVPPGIHYFLVCPNCGSKQRHPDKPPSNLFCYRCCTIFSGKRPDARFSLLVERRLENQDRPELLLTDARNSLVRLLNDYVHLGRTLPLLRSCSNAGYDLARSPFSCRRLRVSPLKVKADFVLKSPQDHRFDALLFLGERPMLGINLAISPLQTTFEYTFPWVTLSAGQMGYSRPFRILSTNVPAQLCEVCAEARA